MNKRIIGNCVMASLGCVILAFGMYNIHSISNVTEGGVLGLTLLLEHWFGISPAVSSIIMDVFCYAFGIRVLGKSFILYSLVASLSFSASYFVFEQFPRIFPAIAGMPLVAALAGAVFVGVGAGLSVRAGGAPGGDDALAMGLQKLLKIKIQWIYLASDILVLGLSLTYIPLERIMYSLLTVVLSGQIIGFVQKAGKKNPDKAD